jgi:hypothetical protein
MGLRPLALPDWIEPDERIAVELAEKARLLRDHHPEVFAVLPEATESAKEVLEVLAAHLPARFPTLYRREGPRLTNLVMQETWDLAQPALHPLELAGRLVQEDLCLMARETTREVYRLVGAAVCFPTRWRLADKLGQPLQAIHAPVPGYGISQCGGATGVWWTIRRSFSPRGLAGERALGRLRQTTPGKRSGCASSDRPSGACRARRPSCLRFACMCARSTL